LGEVRKGKDVEEVPQTKKRKAERKMSEASNTNASNSVSNSHSSSNGGGNEGNNSNNEAELLLQLQDVATQLAKQLESNRQLTLSILEQTQNAVSKKVNDNCRLIFNAPSRLIVFIVYS
jgi:hypothetical protein